MKTPVYAHSLAAVVIATKLLCGIDRTNDGALPIINCQHTLIQLEAHLTRLLHDKWGFRKYGELPHSSLHSVSHKQIEEYLLFCSNNLRAAPADESINVIAWSTEPLADIGSKKKRRKLNKQHSAATPDTQQEEHNAINAPDASAQASDGSNLHLIEPYWAAEQEYYIYDHLDKQGLCDIYVSKTF